MLQPYYRLRVKRTPRETEEDNVAPFTARDMEVESRLTTLETSVASIAEVIEKARPQLAILTVVGSGTGTIVVGVVIWLLTGQK